MGKYAPSYSNCELHEPLVELTNEDFTYSESIVTQILQLWYTKLRGYCNESYCIDCVERLRCGQF